MWLKVNIGMRRTLLQKSKACRKPLRIFSDWIIARNNNAELLYLTRSITYLTLIPINIRIIVCPEEAKIVIKKKVM